MTLWLGGLAFQEALCQGFYMVGIATLFLIFKAFADKGKINLFNFKSKRKKQKEANLAFANIETSKEFDNYDYNKNSSNQEKSISGKDFSENDIDRKSFEQNKAQENNIFDDMK